MKTKFCILAAALSLALGGHAAAQAMSADEAQDLLLDNGYTDVTVIEFRDGMWAATGTDVDGRRIELAVDPVDRVVSVVEDGSVKSRTTVTTTTTTEEVPAPTVVEKVVEKPVVVERIVEQPVVRAPIVVQERVLVPLGGKIDKTTVHAVLAGAGYHDIHDIDWLSNRGVWKAEARDPAGDDREIHVDPYDGSIVHVEED